MKPCVCTMLANKVWRERKFYNWKGSGEKGGERERVEINVNRNMVILSCCLQGCNVTMQTEKL